LTPYANHCNNRITKGEKNMTSATKIRTSCYTYKGWTIELVEGTWLMFPQGESDPTDAANSKRDAMAMVDNWETLDFNPYTFVSIRV
jgi:hypothetical protein